MCGRYTLTVPAEELLEVFGLADVRLDHEPRYNVAPTQTAPVVARDSGGLRIGPLRWGLVPWWADDPSIGNRLINARSETVRRNRAFRDSFERRRCLVPADGFYEWRREGGRKVPYWVHSASGRLLTFAGLWDRWTSPEGERLHSFTILTRDAPDPVRPVHDRMPVIVRPEDRDDWTVRASPPERLQEILRSEAPDDLELRRVSMHVNRPENDDPSCLDPMPEEPEAAGGRPGGGPG